MIQIIGLMIGFYIVTRMAELIVNKEYALVVRILALLTLIGSMAGNVVLFKIGASSSPLPPFQP